jgi:predicted TIM-barrel fold metal-dependent hydrolase
VENAAATAEVRALELVSQYDEELRRLLPAGADVFDVHVHLGRDIDGMVGDYDQLEGLMARYGVSRAFAFCLDEPDRHPAFTAANDRTLAFAARSGGRLIPFVRLDLNESPIEEAARCLDRGARGIKLHPRAQRFSATDERLGPVFRLASERHVPILIHAGQGLPPIADGLHALLEQNPEATLILAHGGIADLAQLATHFAGHPRVFFDTSVWSPVDLLDFYARIPPEQVLYASDYPYGQQPASLLITLRTALFAGCNEQQLRAILGATGAALADGREPPRPTRPLGSHFLEQPMPLARIHQYVSMATPLLWSRQPDTVGVLGLAINATAERNGRVDVLDRIRELLTAARDVWASAAQIEDEARKRETTRLAFRLIHIADIESVTSGD